MNQYQDMGNPPVSNRCQRQPQVFSQNNNIGEKQWNFSWPDFTPQSQHVKGKFSKETGSRPVKLKPSATPCATARRAAATAKRGRAASGGLRGKRGNLFLDICPIANWAGHAFNVARNAHQFLKILSTIPTSKFKKRHTFPPALVFS
jgi:hypothetical protein